MRIMPLESGGRRSGDLSFPDHAGRESGSYPEMLAASARVSGWSLSSRSACPILEVTHSSERALWLTAKKPLGAPWFWRGSSHTLLDRPRLHISSPKKHETAPGGAVEMTGFVPSRSGRRPNHTVT